MEQPKKQMNLPGAGAQAAPVSDQIDMMEMAYCMLAKWKLIVGLALLCALLSGAYTMFLVTPKYQATSSIYVLSPSDSALNFSDLQLGAALTKDYVKIFKIWEVHEEVRTNLDLPYTYKQMQKMLSVRNESDTRILDITVTSPSPEEAAAMANEYARVARAYIAETMATDPPNILSVALVPANPVSPSKTMNILLGFVLGGALSCGYAAVSFLLDDKFKTAEDIMRYAGLTNLATIPLEDDGHSGQKARRRHETH